MPKTAKASLKGLFSTTIKVWLNKSDFRPIID